MSGVEGEKEEISTDRCYMYAIPLEDDAGVSTPAYEPSINGGQYMYHYGPTKLYIIQGKAAGHFHKDSVNVTVEELDREEVESTDNLVERYV